jgi:voltage-gated potassium channel Kch
MARQLGLPVVIGDAFREETLRAAGLDTAMALVSVASQDIVNLETALNARALKEDLRIVLRLADDDLAERLQKTTGNTISQAGLAGSRIADAEQDGQARLLALQVSGSPRLDWSPPRGYRLGPGDRLIVLATRTGLGSFLSVH